ncbi:MAG: ABC transporter permease [Gemmatimonadaceae bacterium]
MTGFRDVVERLRALVFRSREDRDLEEELRFHVDMESARNRLAGMTEVEARRSGLVALGGIERTKEEVRDARGTRLLEDCVSDFGYTLRALRRSPGFALVAILTLAIGIGGTTAVFSAVDAVLLQPLPYQQPGQLVRLYTNYGKGAPDEHGFVTPVHFVEYRARASAFASMAAILTYNETGADIGTGADVRRIRLLPVSADYFDVIRVRPMLGRAFERESENGAHDVVLSHALWSEHFHGDPDVVGRVLTMNGAPYTITGVMPAGFADPLAGAIDAWVPMDLTPAKDASNAGNHYLSIVARLRPETALPRAQAELDLLSTSIEKQYPDAKDQRARIYPLKEDIVGSSAKALQIMLGAVGLVLVLVCVNIANLLLVRGSERAREFALRSALGAERARLVRQLLIESLTLAIAGDVAGLIVARIVMSAIVALGAGSFPRLTSLTLEPRLLAFSLVVATASALAFGLAPARRAARTQPSDVLHGEGRAATGGGAQLRLRDWLVVSQVAVAFVLLVGAGLLLASFQRIRDTELGVKPNGVMVFELHLPDARYDSTARARFYETFAKAIEALPGVSVAGGISRLPATGPYHQWGAMPYSGPMANVKQNWCCSENRVVSGDYFRAAGIPLVDGRVFDARDDVAAPERIVVSQSLAKWYFPGVSAVGQRVRAGSRISEVIGVVGDVAIDAEGTPDRYTYHAHTQFAGDRNWALTQLVRASGALEPLRAEARRTLASLDPQLVMFKPTTLAEAIGRGEAQRVFTLRILASFALVALALAALGLFGVLSYGVRLRSREFGIRMALGAERGTIRRMVLWQGLTVTAIGIAVGLAGAVALSRLMATVLFRVSPLDPTVLAGAAAFMAIVAGVAAYVPAHRATGVEPRSALQ